MKIRELKGKIHDWKVVSQRIPLAKSKDGKQDFIVVVGTLEDGPTNFKTSPIVSLTETHVVTENSIYELGKPKETLVEHVTTPIREGGLALDHPIHTELRGKVKNDTKEYEELSEEFLSQLTPLELAFVVSWHSSYHDEDFQETLNELRKERRRETREYMDKVGLRYVKEEDEEI